MGPDEGKALPHIGRPVATATQTGGSFEVIDYVGPAAHVHHMRDEGFYILDGSFTFALGEEWWKLRQIPLSSSQGGPGMDSQFGRVQSAPVHRASGPGGVLRGTW